LNGKVPVSSHDEMQGLQRDNQLDAQSDSLVRRLLGSVEHDSNVIRTSYSTHTQSMFADNSDQTMSVNRLDQYRMSVFDEHFNVRDSAADKLFYMSSELTNELSVYNFRKLEFWLMWIFLVVSYYLRLLIHYTGEFIWLSVNNIPIIAFTPSYSSIVMSYPTDNVSATFEMMMVLIGPLFNMSLFVFMCIFALAWQNSAFDAFPDSGSRFIACFGIMTLFDALLVLIVDLSTGNSIGDAFKLFTYFAANEGSGVPGVVLTVLFYTFLFCISAIGYYQYLLYIHMNGRILDVYRRLRAPHDSLFAPDDLELSVRNLRYVLAQAKRWTGLHGATRKIAVTTYITTDHLDAKFESRVIHVAIYTQELNGQVLVSF
jgi:hypothetical protein